MTTYIVGDVQGCFTQLSELLLQLNFNPDKDKLGFAGDLVNRGPDSLSVLRLATAFKNTFAVLGNHDLSLLAIAFGVIPNKHPTLQKILDAKDRKKIIDWLLEKPLMIRDKEKNYSLVHAGIPPQWSIEKAHELATETAHLLRANPENFLKNMYGNSPEKWSDNLEGSDRNRYIINALTRVRFCSESGELDLHNTEAISPDPTFRPWFDWRPMETGKIIFGHWASLEGKCEKSNYYALDTGCVWGNSLTAVETETWKLHSVSCRK